MRKIAGRARLSAAAISGAALAFLAPPLSAHAAGERSDLRVVVEGVRAGSGYVLIGLFDRTGGFPAWSQRRAGVRMAADSRSVAATFSGLPVGLYAVAVLHDVDGDGTLTRNVFGAPLEGRGCTNGAVWGVDTPAFDEAAVAVSRPAETVVLRLDY